ncbi:MAG: alpha/beta hydrolase [Rudaea sp.]|uniref:alpha/beta hydrolase n=1 Tax=Rudaea sp. TaxID=2136325 RepID=UPI0039E3E9ED
MKNEESELAGSGGIRLFSRSWRADDSRASVVIVHGVGEHSGRYAHVARRLVAAGCSVHAIDLRGHGRSQGRRAVVDRFANAVEDIDRLVERVRAESPGRPLYMLGHSMGGALSLNYALEHGDKLSGLALSAPAVALDGAPWIVRQSSKLLSLVAPNLGAVAVNAQWISRDRDVVSDYVADPLNWHGRLPVRTVGELVTSAERLPKRLASLDLPILLMHGTDDRLAGISGSRMVHAGVSSTDKKLLEYKGLYHEIFNELPVDRKRVLDDLVVWIEARIAGD